MDPQLPEGQMQRLRGLEIHKVETKHEATGVQLVQGSTSGQGVQ